MKVINESTEMVDVRTLLPHPKNPNIGDTDAISESIDQNGFYGTVIAQRSTGHILVGHHRFKAAVSMGAKELPVTFVDVDNQRALKIMLADNRTAEKAHRDDQLLADLLSELQLEDEDLKGTGYDPQFLDELIEKLSGTEKEADLDSETYHEKFQVVVDCQDEADQEQVFNAIREMGYTCRVLTL